MNKVIYIIGVGRSGTSLLMTLLNGHSKIAFTPETHFLRFYLGNEQVKSAFEGKGVEAFKTVLAKDEYYKRLHHSSEELLEKYIKGKEDFDLNEVYLQILNTYRTKKNKDWIGDKDPRYIDYLPVIKSICPEAKIIHIYRDPRDLVLSKMKANWSAHRPYWLNAMISQIQMKKGRETAQKLFGKNYYELSYESLTKSPENALTDLLHFLKLDYEAGMLNLQKSAKELVDENELQWKNNTFKPVMNVNSKKWMTKLTAIQIRSIELICKEWFEKLSYEKSEVSISSWREKVLQTIFSFEGIQEQLYKYQLRKKTKAKVE